MNPMLRRMLGAARLDAEIYEEVEADRSATGQAFLVVFCASVAAGIGGIEDRAFSGILWHTIHGLVLWYVWAYVTYFVGTRVLPSSETSADHGELLRTIGFSSAPGLLRAFGVITPSARSKPGALEKPIVRSSSPWSDAVSAVGSNRVPMKQVM